VVVGPLFFLANSPPRLRSGAAPLGEDWFVPGNATVAYSEPGEDSWLGGDDVDWFCDVPPEDLRAKRDVRSGIIFILGPSRVCRGGDSMQGISHMSKKESRNRESKLEARQMNR
jgi:hypothetical protein